METPVIVKIISIIIGIAGSYILGYMHASDNAR